MNENQLELPELISSTWCEYYDADRIKPPDYLLRRLDDRKGNRFYYEKDPFETRAGITSLLQRVLPPSYAITEWQKKHGDKADYMLNVSSRFGTSEHIVNKDWLTKKEMNQDQIQKGIDCCKEYGANSDMPYKDFVSFMKFCEDYQVKPLLCEGILKAQFNGEWYAMTLDLLCEITIKTKETKIIQEEKKKQTVEEIPDGFYKTGKKAGMPKVKKVTKTEIYFIPKEIVEQKTVTRICLVDYKSNFFEKTEKDFYEAHLYQLMATREAVRQNFGIDVDVIMNYSPNAWRTSPDYSKKIWEVKESDTLLFNNLLEQARLRGYFRPQGKVFVQLPITPETKHTEAYRFCSYEEYAALLEIQEEEEEIA